MHERSAVSIREAVRRDAEQISALWLAIMQEHEQMDERWQLADDAPKRWLNDLRWWVEDDVHRVLVASVGDDLVGFIHAYLWEDLPIYANGTEVFIATLYVTASMRRKGIASALMEQVREWAIEVRAVRLRLGILSGNEEGIAFWESQNAMPLSVFYTIPLDEGEISQDHKKPRRRIGFV